MGPVKCHQSRAEPEKGQGKTKGRLAAGQFGMPHTASTQTIGGVYAQQAEGSAEKRRQTRRGLKDVCCALKKSGTQAQWLTGVQTGGRKRGEKHPRRSWQGFMACAHALRAVAPRKRGHSYRGGRCPSGSALGARPEDGGSNTAGGAGSVGAPSIPLNTGRALPSICPSTGGGARCCRCVWCLRVPFVFMGGGGKMDETSTRSAGIGVGAGC